MLRKNKNRTGVSSSSAAQVPTPAPADPSGPEYFSGETITPEEGAAQRIDSAADIDPNVKAYGLAGVFQGGGGGYGGAGTK